MNEHDKNIEEIKENLQNVVSGYFNQFSLRFDSFNDQLKVADVLLNMYKYRYSKMKKKFELIDDINLDNIEELRVFQDKMEKMENLDAKLSHIEAKIHILNNLLVSIEQKLDK